MFAVRLATSVSSVDAVDQVDRVEHVALRLRHLLAFLVAHDRVDVHVAERHVAGEVGRRHDHARDPEEDDVEAGDQHATTAGTCASSGVSSGQPSVEWHHSAELNQVSSTSSSRVNDCGSRPSFARACSRARRFVARDVDVARVVVPRRDLVAPPELARDAPVLDVVDPVQVGRQPFAGHERARVSPLPGAPAGKPASPTAARHRSWIERPGKNGCVAGAGLRHRHEPLVGEHRLDDLAGAPAARHDHLVRLLGDDEALRPSRSASTALRAT